MSEIDSESGGNDSCDHPGHDLEGEGSVASSHASEMQDTSGITKRTQPPQILGKTWVFHGNITTDKLHTDSDLGMRQTHLQY
jgi:hypothetical protein